MKVILSNGTELIPIMVTGEKVYFQGAERDSLTFVFGKEYSMDELDGIFTESNCESIKIVEDSNDEYIHVGYAIRSELVKKLVITQESTVDTAAVSESRVMITMAQRTYAETKLAQVAQESTDTQLAVAELAELMMA